MHLDSMLRINDYKEPISAAAYTSVYEREVEINRGLAGLTNGMDGYCKRKTSLTDDLRTVRSSDIVVLPCKAYEGSCTPTSFSKTSRSDRHSDCSSGTFCAVGIGKSTDYREAQTSAYQPIITIRLKY